MPHDPIPAYPTDTLELLEALASITASALERAASAEMMEKTIVESESEKLRNILLSSVSHDLRTPLAAITGAQTDRMTRDDGWRLLSIGRHVERLHFLASALARSFETGAVDTDGGFEALLTLFDSTITFHAQYQQSRDIAALTDLLVLDRDNPRSLAWVAHTLRGRLAKLALSPAGELSTMSLQVPNPDTWDLAHLCDTPEGEPSVPALRELLEDLSDCAFDVSEDISTTYFTHSGQTKHSVGT